MHVLNAVHKIPLYGFVFFILLCNAVYDIKYKRIFIVSLIISVPVCIFLLYWLQELSPEKIAGGVSIGLLLMLCSFFTKGQIGMGDGMLFCFTGVSLSFFENFYLLYSSLILSAVLSVILMWFKKVERKTKIPFVPFVAGSYCLLFVFYG